LARVGAAFVFAASPSAALPALGLAHLPGATPDYLDVHSAQLVQMYCASVSGSLRWDNCVANVHFLYCSNCGMLLHGYCAPALSDGSITAL
jgi:hypothetical protein